MITLKLNPDCGSSSEVKLASIPAGPDVICGLTEACAVPHGPPQPHHGTAGCDEVDTYVGSAAPVRQQGGGDGSRTPQDP